MRWSLEQAGYEVTEAADGMEALEILASSRIPIVISDLDMPRMDGLTLCKEIRGSDFGGYIYVILLTSHSETSDRITGLSIGADDYISKPFNKTELVARVRCGTRVLQLETRQVLIFSLAKLAESRDNDTGLHLERVQRYANLLMARLAVDSSYAATVTPEFRRLLYETCPLHDIGKVGIADAVLLKPGKLTKEEFECMKQHTIIGAKTLKGAMDLCDNAIFLSMAYDIALTHHERFDGTGYPQGLRGNAIPLSGRIVALVDVYDALTTRRVYKAAFPHSEAYRIIVEGSGTHFDPEIVRVFVQCEQEFDRIRSSLADDACESQAVTVRSATKILDFEVPLEQSQVIDLPSLQAASKPFVAPALVNVHDEASKAVRRDCGQCT